MAGFDPSGCLDPVIEMAAFEFKGASEPVVGMAGFELSAWLDPGVEMAAFDRLSRSYLATVSRSTPSSRAMRRYDQFCSSKPMIAWIFAILSLFAMHTSFANTQKRYTPFRSQNGGV
jgi:hypothetical protein